MSEYDEALKVVQIGQKYKKTAEDVLLLMEDILEEGVEEKGKLVSCDFDMSEIELLVNYTRALEAKIREALTIAAEIERGDKVVVAERDVLNIKHYINEHPNLGQYFCCGSHECGCQGASHLEYVEHLLEALIEASEAENDHE